MAEIKVRDYVRASSLGSYFGVGYNSPKDQFLIDTGQAVEEFDDAAQDRLNLGVFLENPALDFFEKKLGVTITGRNVKTKHFLDGMLVGKMDGEYVDSDGTKVIVENKISNAQSGVFTENLGYLIQVQSYLLDKQYEKALLCGLYQGKPTYKFILPDEQMQKDIQEMVTFVTSCMMGLLDFDKDYPVHLYEKYAKTKPSFLPIEDVSLEDVMTIEKVADIKEQIKALEKELEPLECILKEKYTVGKIQTESGVVMTLSEGVRKGSFDVTALMIEHPELNYDAYYKPSSTYRTLKVVKK